MDEELTDNIANNDDADDVLADDFQEETLPTMTFKVADGRVIGVVDDYDAMVQAIDKIMRTERFVFPIYTEDYGNDLEDLVGADFEYIKVEAERMIDEALQADDRVTGVYVDEITQVASDSVQITGSVETIFGNVDFTKGVSVNDDE
ncbi:DUF2634 domain-containing protein [Apilactobacillus sp. EABW-1NA]|uniref:DUF2634 domain-containing protein n=1 Tax=Apilactobacillus sp. EABW-1NA TaxID=2984137 RepID=UPI0025AEF940|nr:DUF2634 domain-containing protein [Apilactobacillus sp. EABW-1NA]MDN2612964.1 DUF2634 domain-containing protein [Apilactobacillus sp. EABW-1NA]